MIICCGEALIDICCAHHDGRAKMRFFAYAGGGTFQQCNRAWAAGWSRPDFSPAVRAICSADILRDVTHKKVAWITALSATLDLHTTLGFRQKLVNGQASYAFFDENTAGRIDHRSPHLPSLNADVERLCFSARSA